MNATSRNAIVMETRGGLGNQLFQLALGLQIATSRQCHLELDASWHLDHPERPFELDSLDLTGIQVRTQKSWGRTALHRLVRRAPQRLAPTAQRLTSTRIETGLSFDPLILSTAPGSRLSGYFQSWKYFVDVTDHVRTLLSGGRAETEWYREQRQLLDGLGPFIGVHLRRGDYTTATALSIHGLASATYYASALSRLQGTHGDLPVVVFSDDVEQARGVLDAPTKDVYWLDAPHQSPSIESLLLLSQAAHLVIANSSFSWWAAWLGDKPSREVVAPRPWLVSDPSLGPDLIPPDWSTLPA